jgi:hypothetical protein
MRQQPSGPKGFVAESIVFSAEVGLAGGEISNDPRNQKRFSTAPEFSAAVAWIVFVSSSSSVLFGVIRSRGPHPVRVLTQLIFSSFRSC